MHPRNPLVRTLLFAALAVALPLAAQETPDVPPVSGTGTAPEEPLGDATHDDAPAEAIRNAVTDAVPPDADPDSTDAGVESKTTSSEEEADADDAEDGDADAEAAVDRAHAPNQRSLILEQ